MFGLMVSQLTGNIKLLLCVWVMLGWGHHGGWTGRSRWKKKREEEEENEKEKEE